MNKLKTFLSDQGIEQEQLPKALQVDIAAYEQLTEQYTALEQEHEKARVADKAKLKEELDNAANYLNDSYDEIVTEVTAWKKEQTDAQEKEAKEKEAKEAKEKEEKKGNEGTPPVEEEDTTGVWALALTAIAGLAYWAWKTVTKSEG